MINRIIFLIENRFYSRDYQRFGIELLRNNGFCVEIWELWPILYPELLQSRNAQDMFYDEGLVGFNAKTDAYVRLSILSDRDFVINLVSYNHGNLWVYKALSKSGADYAVMYANSLPMPAVNNKSLFKILEENIRYLASFRRVNRWKSLYMNLPSWFNNIKSPRLILAGGDRCIDNRYPFDKNTEILNGHSFDYDLYLKYKDTPVTERPIAVFLDEFLPFHPDYVFMGNKAFSAAEAYFPSLNGFFDLVEKETGLEVVIAAHPKSDYENRPDCFNGRRCIKGKTLDLVREAKLVLAHASTSLNIANLFYKPVIFITSLDLDKSYAGVYISEIAKWFGKKPININNDYQIDWDAELMCNKEKYEAYRKAYIKSSGSEVLPLWQIVANELKRGFHN